MGQLGNFAPSPSVLQAGSFAKPLIGGTLAAVQASVAYTDTTAKALFTLPKGAVPVFICVDVTTAFNAGDTNVLDIGVAGTGNNWKNDLAVGSAGQTVTGWAASILGVQLTIDTALTATYVPAGTAADAGAAKIIVLYYLAKI